MTRPFWLCALSVIVLLLPATALVAQTSPSLGSVSADGTATLECQPELLRLKTDLLAKAGTLEEALEALTARKGAAREKLIELGASPASISLDPPRIIERSQREAQIETMLQYQDNVDDSLKEKLESLKQASPVKVAATLTVEWPLKAREGEALLLESHQITEKVHAADLAGQAEFEKLSPQEEELAEEMEEYRYMMDNDGPKPGTPIFLFVARVNEAEQDRLMKQAFDKARAKAERLAKAAGRGLGDLQQIMSHSMNSFGESDMYGWYGYNAYAQRFMRQLQPDTDEDAVEAVGTEAGQLRYRVTVTTSFALK
jgi:uncharacterized protein YggE